MVVDEMSYGFPGGHVWESNEEDNVYDFECRILGMPPDYDGPPPC